MHLGQPRRADGLERALESRLVLRGKADDHVGGQVEVGERLELAQIGLDRVAARHRAEHAVVARLERHVQVRAYDRRLAERGDELVVDVVDLDRGEPEPLDALDRARSTDQRRERVAGGTVAKAAEVDACEDDLAMTLCDALADLAEHRVGAAAPRGAADERDHAERARERAAVLDLDEGPHAVEPRVRLHAADRAHVTGDGLDRLLDLTRNDGDVRGQPGERGVREAGAAAGHVDASVRACRARGGLTRLREAFVRDAAGVDEGDVPARLDLAMPVADEPLAQRLRVGLGDLAAEEPDGEARHAAEKANDGRGGPQPSRRPGRAARRGSRRAPGRPKRGSRT